MKMQRMKLDYNHLLETIDEVMSNSRSKIAIENRFGIGIGLNLLTNYIKEIAERAIELNDEILLDLLQNMMVIKQIDHSTEKGETDRQIQTAKTMIEKMVSCYDKTEKGGEQE